MSATKKPLVFLSFTATAFRLLDGSLTEEEFKNGIHFFGCARVHVLGDLNYTPWATEELNYESTLAELVFGIERWFKENYPEASTEAVTLCVTGLCEWFQDVVRRSEKDGRCWWHHELDVPEETELMLSKLHKNVPVGYAGLIEMMKKNGVPVDYTEDDFAPWKNTRYFTYPKAQDLLARSGVSSIM